MIRGRAGRVFAMFLCGLLGVILGGGLAGWLVLRAQEERELAQPFVVAPEGHEKGNAITEAVRRAGPAVVLIKTKLAPAQMPEGLPELFGLPGPLFPEGQGSGVIVNAKNGYVITNNHVLQGATEITVRLADEREFAGRKIASDQHSDLAILKIQADRLPAITLGSSNELPIGSWLIAIGSPLGLENTVTVGVLSARDRTLQPPDRRLPLDDLLQTDAAINRGNSGGALVNLKGELVGVPTAIVSPSEAQGLGFAVSVERVKEIIPELLAHGRVRRTWLGITYQPVTTETAKKLKLPRAQGMLVLEVIKGAPAAKARLRNGDVILSVDNNVVHERNDLRQYVHRRKVGDVVTLDILREGRKVKIRVRLDEMPSDLPTR